MTHCLVECLANRIKNDLQGNEWSDKVYAASADTMYIKIYLGIVNNFK